MATDNTPDFSGTKFDTAECAEYLHTTTSQLTMWRQRGQGPKYFKLVGKVLYLKADVNAWMANAYNQPCVPRLKSNPNNTSELLYRPISANTLIQPAR